MAFIKIKSTNFKNPIINYSFTSKNNTFLQIAFCTYVDVTSTFSLFLVGFRMMFETQKNEQMKYYLLIFTLLCLGLCEAQEFNKIEKDAKGREKLIGKINKEGLTSASFNKWFSEGMTNYSTDANISKKLKRKLRKCELVVFMGTWCGDSRKEIPRLYSVLEAIDFPEEQLQVVALDNKRSHYKQSPTGEEVGLNIHRVPTIIVYKNGKELDRIVEHPVTSIEADLLVISRKKEYAHHYQIVTQLNTILENTTAKAVLENSNQYASDLKEYSKKASELNTYGYVLFRANKMKKALAAFTINTLLFPDNKNTFDSLGEAYFATGNYEKAILNYKKVLALDANDKNAKEMLSKIQKTK